MAHEVEVINGQASMMYVGQAPWHKLGTQVASDIKIADAIVAAGLDWNVGLKPLQTADGEKVRAAATYRETDGRILGVVGPDYRVLQNSKAFEFFQPFLDTGVATLETAGSLRGGERIWVLAKIKGDPMVVKGNDIVDRYILLSNGHDGVLAVRAGYSAIRTVCANTLAMAHSSSKSQLIRIRHVGDVEASLDMVGQAMQAADQTFEVNMELYRKMANTSISAKDFEKFVKVVFTEPKKMAAAIEAGTEDDITSGKRLMDKLVPLFERGRGNDMPEIKHTVWSAYNAISEHLQYNSKAATDAARLDSLWYGSGAQVNKRALDTAAKIVA
jgi:phage/plasmid-like protein (TIGR03299 family)